MWKNIIKIMMINGLYISLIHYINIYIVSKMVEHLVKDPNKLYEICNYRELEEYYPFSFIGNFNSIEVDI